MNTYRLRITTPDADMYDGEALQLSLRVSEGDIAIMAGHIPFVSSVVEGQAKVYLPDGAMRRAECSAGLLTVSADSVRLLCSEFRWSE